jgi:hypothetical protein
VLSLKFRFKLEEWVNWDFFKPLRNSNKLNFLNFLMVKNY